MSDYDIDRIRVARDASIARLRTWIRVSLEPREPITIVFCAADFCVVCS